MSCSKCQKTCDPNIHDGKCGRCCKGSCKKCEPRYHPCPGCGTRFLHETLNKYKAGKCSGCSGGELANQALNVHNGEPQTTVQHQSWSDADIKGFLDDIKEHYMDYLKSVGSANKVSLRCELKGSTKHCRVPNFPESVSEPMVYLAMKKKGRDARYFEVATGDLTEGINNDKIESKASCGNGPSSFGPTEHWKRLAYINVYNHTHCRIRIIDIPDMDDCFQKLVLSKRTGRTYADYCRNKCRPRFDLDKFITEHVKNEEISTIYEGPILDLLNSY